MARREIISSISRRRGLVRESGRAKEVAWTGMFSRSAIIVPGVPSRGFSVHVTPSVAATAIPTMPHTFGARSSDVRLSTVPLGPAWLCDDTGDVCQEGDISLSTEISNDPNVQCVLQEGLSIDGQPVYACTNVDDGHAHNRLEGKVVPAAAITSNDHDGGADGL